MFQEIILDVILLLFLLTCLWEDSLKPNAITIASARKVINNFTPKQIAAFLFSLMALLFLLEIKGYGNFFSLYIYTILSLLIIFHAIWLAWRLNNKKLLIIPIFVILAIVLYPSVLTHDIFVFLVVVWLGAAIASFKSFTREVFLILSIIWFIYDIFYIWITSGYHLVQALTNKVNFPLSIIVVNSSIGLTDLFYAALLISIIRDIKYKYSAILLLIVSDILLAYYNYHIQSINTFPLLVVWVPCGLFILLLEHFKTKNEKKL